MGVGPEEANSVCSAIEVHLHSYLSIINMELEFRLCFAIMMVMKVVYDSILQYAYVVMAAGHTRKVRPELFQLQWTEASDLILVGDLVEACNVHDLDKQGLEFKTIMQAGNCNAEDALTHAWLKC